VWLSRIIKVQL